jgi:DNA-binding LacI/PurR family transcriptional regulator
MTASIKDVAIKAGVSSATVSRVLTEKPYISENARLKVMEAVKELGYQPSRVARSLRVRTTQIIGLIIPDVQNPFYTSLVRAIEDQAYAHNYTLFLCNTDENRQKETLYVDLMIAERVAGVIIIPAQETGSSLLKLLKMNIPVVAVDRRIKDKDLDLVILNNLAASYELIVHLIKQGHRHIAAILGSFEITTGRERFEGYKAALADNGIELDPSLIRTGSPKEIAGYKFANELLSLPNPPTALFTGNNMLTFGALRAIRERGLNIPRDLSLVAFDDLDWMSLISPKLTVISQPTYEMGKMSFDLLLRRISEPNHPFEQIIFKAELKIRESTCPLEISEIR